MAAADGSIDPGSGSEQEEARSAAAHLAAIVESSNDAIISKTLEGVIRSWNGGAERIFGWSAAEAIGRPITLIIPPGRLQEEQHILEPLELASVISQAFETVEPQLRQKRHKVSVISSYEPLYVNGDFARLVQCVANILNNAIKYTDPGGEIQVRTRMEGSSAVIEVTDNGLGIPPDLLPRVFDIFVQGDGSIERAQGGLGVGLALVKRLVDQHDGAVGVRSPGTGQGSTFSITLPRIARPHSAAKEHIPLRVEPRRVLIVDDNADAASSLAMLLGLRGHETQVAFDGREALQRLESFQPDVVLLDIGLPGTNGYELARRLRAMPKLQAARFVALTGYGQVEAQQRALAAGFDDYVVKPVNIATLERALAGGELTCE